MDLFLDSAQMSELRDLCETGLISGITTNPTLIAQAGGDMKKTLREICSLVEGPVSAEVIALDYKGMMKEAQELLKIAENIAVKVPLTVDGLRACRDLSNDDKMVNVTLCFSAAQALLASKAGATFISPFVGRIDDIGYDGIALIKEIDEVYMGDPENITSILAASIRHPRHVIEAAKAGATCATIPPKIFRQLYNHPLTDKGIEQFLKDWSSTGQTIV
jgi:transaldolase